MYRTKQRSLLDETLEGLDCIDLTYYLGGDSSFEEIADAIQADFERNWLPSEAMAIFSKSRFHGDVFRAMDEAEMERYFKSRFGIDDEELSEYFEDWDDVYCGEEATLYAFTGLLEI